jgi:hypothetical protein
VGTTGAGGAAYAGGFAGINGATGVILNSYAFGSVTSLARNGGQGGMGGNGGESHP